MYERLKKVMRRRLIIIDLASLLAAFLLALTVRYGFPFHAPEWQLRLYWLVILLALLGYAILFQFFDERHKPIPEQDLLDCIIAVFQNSAILFIILLLSLYSTKTAELLSRLVLGLSWLLFFLIDLALRLYYRRGKVIYIRDYIKPSDVLLITSSTCEELVRSHFEREGGMNRIGEVFLLDELPENWTDLSFKQEYERALVYLPGYGSAYVDDVSHENSLQRVIHALEQRGITVHIAVRLGDLDVGGRMLSQLGPMQTVTVPAMKTRCNVLGVQFNVSNVDSAIYYVRTHLSDLAGKYICFCNVHTTMMSYRDADYQTIQNSAALTFADGAPIAREQQHLDFTSARRVAGPDFMDAMFKATMDGSVSHYFYGSTEETIRNLQEELPKRYPGIRIAGAYSPPFKPLEDITEDEDQTDLQRINNSGADLIWIGLGAPKQEKWMATHEGKLGGVMLGVGAGFDFYAGTVKRAPDWVKKIGMEWLYRLFQDPKRLWKRYITTNTEFLALILKERLRSVGGPANSDKTK